MADFLLIHGAAHGAWCWRDTIPALRALGHTARAIDLPSHGNDKTPVDSITLQTYSAAILAALDTPTIVVGHSMAGYSISHAAQTDPRNIARLIYLCAYVPEGEKTLSDRRRDCATQPIVPAIIRAPGAKHFTLDLNQTTGLFYNDCTPEIAEFANARLSAQAVAPSETPCPLGANYATVPRAYIRCMDDRTIPPACQIAMTKNWPREDVYGIDTGHSPFFADPAGLAQLLDTISQT